MLKWPIIGTLIGIIITIAMYSSAVESQSGEVAREFTGKHAFIKSAVYSLSGTLGPTGSIIVGSLFTLLMLSWLFVSLKKSKQDSGAAVES